MLGCPYASPLYKTTKNHAGVPTQSPEVAHVQCLLKCRGRQKREEMNAFFLARGLQTYPSLSCPYRSLEAAGRCPFRHRLG
jgi:hypothetical protein